MENRQSDDPMDRLRLLLQSETFPHVYLHKMIGVKSVQFLDGLAALQMRYPQAKQVATRDSVPPQGSSQGAYVAVTYAFSAKNADEIIEFLTWSSKLPDLRYSL